MAEDFDIAELLKLVTPEGQANILRAIKEAKERTGKDFVLAVKNQYPYFARVIDLAANHTAEESYNEIYQEVEKRIGPIGVSFAMGPQVREAIYQLHANLRAEIDRPRFPKA